MKAFLLISQGDQNIENLSIEYFKQFFFLLMVILSMYYKFSVNLIWSDVLQYRSGFAFVSWMTFGILYESTGPFCSLPKSWQSHISSWNSGQLNGSMYKIVLQIRQHHYSLTMKVTNISTIWMVVTGKKFTSYKNWWGFSIFSLSN